MDNKCNECGYEYNKDYEVKCPLCGKHCEECGKKLGAEWSYTDKYGLLCKDCKI